MEAQIGVQTGYPKVVGGMGAAIKYKLNTHNLHTDKRKKRGRRNKMEEKKEEAEEFAKSVGLAYKEVSAKEDINV